jgi:hypothetical protein
MAASELTGRLGAATARMDRVLDGFTDASPEALDGCAGLLELSCRELAGSSGWREGVGDAGALAEALRLRTRIRLARRLLDAAYRFHSCWGQILGARTGGYLRGGQAAPAPGAIRLFLRG